MSRSDEYTSELGGLRRQRWRCFWPVAPPMTNAACMSCTAGRRSDAPCADRFSVCLRRTRAAPVQPCSWLGQRGRVGCRFEVVDREAVVHEDCTPEQHWRTQT